MSNENNVNNVALYDEPVNYNPTAELNPSTKIPDGWYLMELSLKKEPVAKPIGQQPCVEANIQGTIIAPGDKLNGFRTSGYVNSYVFESGASPLHQLLKGIGQPAPAYQTVGQLRQQVEAALAQPQQARARLRWEASTKNSEGAQKPYLRVKGMRNFPELPGGGYDPSITFTLDDGTTVTVEAREVFVDFKSPAAVQVAG